MALKRISSVITGTNRDLVQSERKYPQRALVLNLTTGEIRKGPGKWNDLPPAYDSSTPDVVVAAATTANIDIETALLDGETLDGVTLAAGDLVLVKDQTLPEENGLYAVVDTPVEEGDPTPARAPGYDTYSAHAGTTVLVDAGTVNTGKGYVCASSKTGTLDTTAIVFARMQGALQSDVAQLPAADAADAAHKLMVQLADGTLATVTAAQLKTFVTA